MNQIDIRIEGINMNEKKDASFSPYFQFVASVNTLIKCYNRIKPEEYDLLPLETQQAFCKREKMRVLSFFKDDSLKYSNIIQNRLDLLKQFENK